MKHFREKARLLALLAASLAAAVQAAPATCIAPPAGASIDQIVAGMPAAAPQAIEWAQRRAGEILAAGAKLTPAQVEIARKVGVRHPEKVRILVADRIQLPEDPALRRASASVGLAAVSADGLTLGYAIVLRRPERDNVRLWSHELRHVAQYEACGGIAPFLSVHLAHLARHGYDDAPFEVDARDHEIPGR